MAVNGVAQDADFEIGSISKGITGLLYADACERGEISPATALGELLPLGNCAAPGASLGSLSRHASGMPRQPPGTPGSASPLRRTVSLFLHGANPYGESLVELLEQARAVRLQGPRLQAPRPRYSNLGFELLGHAIAAGAGMSYRDLVAARLCGPLALNSMYMPATPGELGPDCPDGPQPPGPSPAALDRRGPGPGRRHPGVHRRTSPGSPGRSWTAPPRAGPRWTRWRTSPVRQPASALPGSPLMPRGAGSPGTTAARAGSAAGSAWTGRQRPQLSCSRRRQLLLTGRVSSCCRNWRHAETAKR